MATVSDSTDLGTYTFKPNRRTLVSEYRWAEARWNEPGCEVKKSEIKIPALTLLGVCTWSDHFAMASSIAKMDYKNPRRFHRILITSGKYIYVISAEEFCKL